MARPLKVFILGPPRSGTSILYFASGDILHLSGTGESHVMPIFADLTDRFSPYASRFKDTNILASRLDQALLIGELVEHVRRFYGAQYPEGSWVDKTPGPVAGVPFILSAFPDARILLTRRSGIEVVRSHMAKFGVPIQEACRMWRLAMETIVALRRQPPALTARILEQDQFDLTNAAEVSGARIAGHVGRPETALEFASYFRSRRVQQSSAHDWTRRLTLAETGWSDTNKQVFMRDCALMMQTLGYTI